MKLILVRHGQSTYNLENKFTGWKDVGLTDKGYEEAKKAGDLFGGECADLAGDALVSACARHQIWP